MTKVEQVDDDEIPLHLLHTFFWISLALVCLTAPFAIFVYGMIIRSKVYRGRYVYKQIVYNGIVNLLQYIFYIPAIHIGIFTELRSIIHYLNDHKCGPIFLSLFLFFVCSQSHSNLSISINRLIYISHPFRLQSHDRLFYNLSLWSSILIPLVISIPILFTDYGYVERIMSKSKDSIFRIEMPGGNTITLFPSVHIIISNILAILSNIAMVVKMYQIHRKRTEDVFTNSNDNYRIENGLILTTALNGFLHGILYVVGFMTYSLEWIGAGAVQILLISLISILPFWLLIILVPSLRHQLFPTSFVHGNVSVIVSTRNSATTAV